MLSAMRPVHLIGVPLDLGAGRRGVDMGPSAFRIAGLSEQITRLGYSVVDKGDLVTPTPETKPPRDERKKYIREIASVCKRLYESSLASLSDGAIPVVLGGDHSLGAGSVAAAATWARRAHGLPIGLLWVDAHGDMNTPATSLSGNVHGMPLAALLGDEPVGARRHRRLASEGAARSTRSSSASATSTSARRTRSASPACTSSPSRTSTGRASPQSSNRPCRLAGAGTAGIHVSFDMDVCDPAIAPGVGTPVKGGLDYREAHMAMEMLADSGLLTSLDMVEVNPTLDVRNATAQLGTELALSALGMKIL